MDLAGQFCAADARSTARDFGWRLVFFGCVFLFGGGGWEVFFFFLKVALIFF